MSDGAVIHIEGMDRIEAKFGRLREADRSAKLGAIVMAAAMTIEAAAKVKAPIDTGSLRRSIHGELLMATGNVAAAEVGTDLVYAAIQEFGGAAGRGHTSIIPAHPYMRPALDENREKIAEDAAVLFRQFVEEAVRG